MKLNIYYFISILLIIISLTFNVYADTKQEYFEGGSIQFASYSGQPYNCQQFAVGELGDNESYEVANFGFEIAKNPDTTLATNPTFILSGGSGSNIITSETVAVPLTHSLAWYNWTPPVEVVLNTTTMYYICIYHTGTGAEGNAYVWIGGNSGAYYGSSSTEYSMYAGNALNSLVRQDTYQEFSFQVWSIDAPSSTSPVIQKIQVNNTQPVYSNVNLNCSFNITDTDIDEYVNATLTWYRKQVTDTTFSNWNNNNQTFNNITLGSLYSTNLTGQVSYLNTTAGDEWKCGIHAIDKSSNSAYLNSTNISIINLPPTLIYPLNNTILDRILTPNLNVSLNNDLVSNVTFLNASGSTLCSLTNVVPNSNANCSLTLPAGVLFNWSITINDSYNSVITGGTWQFTPNDEPKVTNMRVETNEQSNVIFMWDNEHDMEWISFRLGSEIMEVRSIYGVTQNWTVTNLYNNDEYEYEWQLGDSVGSFSDYYTFNFRTIGWKPELIDFGYKVLITINSSQVVSDLDNNAIKIYLTEDNFQWCTGDNWWDSCYPAFTHLNWTTGDDIRFIDYYEIEELPFEVISWTVGGDGGITTQTLPDSTDYTGSFIDFDNSHDGDWSSQATPDTTGVYYYNYTIPVGALSTSLFRIYDGEWGWDIGIPDECFGGSSLRFKSEADYTIPRVQTYCQNNGDNTWELVRDNNVDYPTASSSYIYETLITWYYDAEAVIVVKPLHFDDGSQTNLPGIDGDYDTKFWMYYGNSVAVNNESTVTYSALLDDSTIYTISLEEEYVPLPPVISNLNDSVGRTSTGTNISWTVDQSVNNRVRYATNEWLLESIWANRIQNTTESFLRIQGNKNTTVLLNVYPEQFLNLTSVISSNTSYNLNYTLNRNATPVSITFINVSDNSFNNWTVVYEENKTWERSTHSPKFMLEDLTTNTQYFYEANAYGLTYNTTAEGNFTLGTLPSTPNLTVYNYTENRPDEEVTVCVNVTDLDSNPSVNVSIQYWIKDVSTMFTETSITNVNSVPFIICKTINVIYNNTYMYRGKAVGNTTGYSEAYENEFMPIQEFFAGNYVEDDNDDRDRQYCPNGVGTLPCYEQKGYWEGSLQEEDWMWVETNISSGNLTLNLYNRDINTWTNYQMSLKNSYCYQETANISTSCGGENTGSYSFTPNYFYINYTKPLYATSNSLWQVKFGRPENQFYNNVSIPISCFDQNKLQFRMYSSWLSAALSYGYGQCYNGSSWQTITPILSEIEGGSSFSTSGGENRLIDGNWTTYSAYSTTNNGWCYPLGAIPSGCGSSAKVYEEAMWWTNSSYSYIRLENLTNNWYTFYITNSTDNIILNWTKPGPLHLETENRIDISKYVSFNGSESTINYKIMYFGDYDYNSSAYQWCMAQPGGNLYDCMMVQYWGGGSEAGLGEELTGSKYDRGQLFRGGIINGELHDSGTLDTYLDPARPVTGPEDQSRYCFAFTVYWWNESIVTSTPITSYYYHYWTQDNWYSTYFGYTQDSTFDYTSMFSWEFDTLSQTRDWSAYSGSELTTRQEVKNVSNGVFNAVYPQYNQSLVIGFKNGFSMPTENDAIYDLGLYTDGQWTNQLFGKYQQGFVIFNLPDNATLQGLDTDSDTLTDYDELFVYYTNPQMADTDEGGLDDGDEVLAGSDPLLYHDDPPVINTVYITPTYPEEGNELHCNFNVSSDNIYLPLNVTVSWSSSLDNTSFTTINDFDYTYTNVTFNTIYTTTSGTGSVITGVNNYTVWRCNVEVDNGNIVDNLNSARVGVYPLQNLTIYSPTNNTFSNDNLEVEFSVVDYNEGLSCYLTVNNRNITTNSCHQETATTSTSCGGNNTGSYANLTAGASTWSNLANSFDESYTTYSSIGGGYGTSDIYINYTKPSNAVNSNWQLKWYNGVEIFENTSIPESCYNYDDEKILLKIVFTSAASGYYEDFSCYRSEGWLKIDGSGFFGHGCASGCATIPRIYEEAIIWNTTIFNSTILSNIKTKATYSLTTDGIYNWSQNCYSTSDSTPLVSELRTFTYDTTSPTANSFIDSSTTLGPEIGDSILLTATINDTNGVDTCSLQVNTTGGFVTQTSTQLYGMSGIPVSFGYTIPMEATAENKNIGWRYVCNDTAGNILTTSTQGFIVKDLTLPTITLNPQNTVKDNNLTVISGYSDNLIINTTFYDYNIFQALVNVTCDVNGSVYYWEKLDMSGTNYTHYVSYGLQNLTPQKCIMYISTSDDHTAKDINVYKETKLNNGLKFNTGDSETSITSLDSIKNVNSRKEKDRYNYNFEFDSKKLERTFVIDSNKNTYERKGSKYPGHFVVWNDETHSGNWIDFYEDDSLNQEYIVKKNGKEYEVTIKVKIPESEIVYGKNKKLEEAVNYNELVEKFGKSKYNFHSIGGTNVDNSSYTFYIGGLVNTTTNNYYDNSSFQNYTVHVVSVDAFPATDVVYTVVNSSTAGIYNLTNGTYIMTFSSEKFFNQTATITVNTLNQSYVYNSYNSILNVIVRNIQSLAPLTNTNITLNNTLSGVLLNRFTNDNSTTVNTFYLNATTYDYLIHRSGYVSKNSSTSVDYLENQTLYVDLGFFANFLLYDEKLSTYDPSGKIAFNISSPNNITFLLRCINGYVYATPITNINTSIPIDCTYENFQFILDYGTSSYNRRFILSPDEAFIVNVYLIDARTTPYLYNSFIIDDLFKNYQNISVYIKKQIGNTTVHIASDYIDVENKLGAWLIENHQYIIEIHSLNQPTRNMGNYNADLSGNKIISLNDISISSSPSDYINSVTAVVNIQNISNETYAVARYLDREERTSSVTFNVYLNSVSPANLLYTSTVLNDSNIEFMQNVSSNINDTLIGEIVAVHETGTYTVSDVINSVTRIPLEVLNYIPANTLNWIITLMLGALAIFATIKTANIVSMALIGLASLFVAFGWFFVSGSALGVAILIAIFSMLKDGSRRE